MIENDLRDPQIYDEFMEYAELKIKNPKLKTHSPGNFASAPG